MKHSTTLYVNNNHYATVDVEDAVEIVWWWIFKTRKSQSFRKKVKGTCIYYLYCAPFWYFIHAYNIYDTHKVYTFTLFSFFLCVSFSYIIQASNFFSSFRPVLECTNFSITWCSRQKRVLTICFISRTQVLIGEHTFMELWSALQTLFIISFSLDRLFHAKLNYRKIYPNINCSIFSIHSFY